MHTENISAYALMMKTVKLLNKRNNSSTQLSSFTEDPQLCCKKFEKHYM